MNAVLPQTSARCRAIKPSKTLAVMRRAQEMRAAGRDVLDLSVGEPDVPTPDPILRATEEALRAGKTKYTPAVGIPALREAVLAKYRRERNMDLGAGQVMIGAGAKGVLYHMAQALLEPGDEVLLPAPYWVTFPEIIALTGARTVPVPLDPADGFALHADALLAQVTDRTRAVILNSPTNPTGSVWDVHEMHKVARACAERGIYVISDECYEHFTFGTTPFTGFGDVYGEVSDVLCLAGSVSKTYSMTGYRIGWAVAPESVIRAMSALQGHSVGNPTTFAQFGALAALSAEQEPLIAPMRETYRQRRALLAGRLPGIPGLSVVPPEGAFYYFMDARELIRRAGLTGDEALCEQLLEKSEVAVVDGTSFGCPGAFRISYALDTQKLLAAVERIAAFAGKFA